VDVVLDEVIAEELENPTEHEEDDHGRSDKDRTTLEGTLETPLFDFGRNQVELLD